MAKKKNPVSEEPLEQFTITIMKGIAAIHFIWSLLALFLVIGVLIGDERGAIGLIITTVSYVTVNLLIGGVRGWLTLRELRKLNEDEDLGDDAD